MTCRRLTCRRQAAAAVALGVLALVGCGSDSNKAAGSTSSTTALISTTHAGSAPGGSTGTPDPAAIAFIKLATMSNPVDLTFRAGDSALYIASRDGFVVAMRNGTIDNTKLLDVSKDITAGGEQGLLGLTFSVDGSHAYVDYTDTNGDTNIVEYAVGADGVFAKKSKRALLTIKQPYSNHNGGQVRIGPDGMLYIGMGDGGSGGDPERRGQNKDELLGKILRIDPKPDGDDRYTIPADNPFVNVDGERGEIWAYGLRNPWRFSFDRTTNDLWIADVGQNSWEEIDVASAASGGGKGLNFGWSAFEGTHPFNDDQPTDGVTMPIHEYPHGPDGCSISGGVRYRGTTILSLIGWYVYADYCSNQVRALQIEPDLTAGAEVILASDQAGVSEIAQGPDGELYALRVDDGLIMTIGPKA